MIKSAFAEVSKDIAPVTPVVFTKILGIPLPDLALYLSIAYAVVRLLMAFPRIIGCATCFWKEKGCSMKCKTSIGD